MEYFVRRLVFTTAAASLGLGLSAPAFAQADAPFTGLHAEALVGYDTIHADSTGVREGGDGVFYGGALGYDFQTGGVVLGVEGEISDSAADSRSTGVFVPGDTFDISAGRDLYVGARIGVVAAPRAMAYLKGGYTNARIGSRYTLLTTTTTDASDLDGVRVGAGVEYLASERIYAKVEYRYSAYSNLDGYDFDVDRHQLLAGVGIRF